MGWVDEFESGYALAQEAARRLKELDPTNELLKYLYVPDGEETNDEIEAALKVEMKNRFWDRDRPWQGVAGAEMCAVVFGNYWSALKKEIERIEKENAIPSPS